MLRLTKRKIGFILGLISSTTYGMIPLFTLPLLIAGVNVESALVYRFAIATFIMGALLLIRRESLKIAAPAFFKIAGLSIFYMFGVLLFFHGFNFLPSGIVATINFIYPVIVLLIMVGFFHESFSRQTVIAVGLAIIGVAVLSIGPMEEPKAGSALSGTLRIVIGFIIVLLGALCNALYYVGIQVARLPKIDGFLMTFYVMFTGSIFCLTNALLMESLEWIPIGNELVMVSLLALITAVISNLTLILGIRRVGSTVISILGVGEPLTAVTIGCLIFGEPVTTHLVIGTILIVSAVILVLLAPKG